MNFQQQGCLLAMVDFSVTLLIHQGDYGLCPHGCHLHSPAPLSVTCPSPLVKLGFLQNLSVFKIVLKIQFIHEPFLLDSVTCFLTSPKHSTLIPFLYIALVTIFYAYFFFVPFLEYELLEGRGFCLFISLLCPQCQQQFITYSRLTTNTVERITQSLLLMSL